MKCMVSCDEMRWVDNVTNDSCTKGDGVGEGSLMFGGVRYFCGNWCVFCFKYALCSSCALISLPSLLNHFFALVT